ncbi:1575_t:CDS:2 [Scutellospora calospora]|uniref:1575_t:CDS:1 n=1 Tax=Scutellospora calospora TaxID=85575 RepID=A0ACA9L772_9GLOM|nr:1575_t:CDS:2 [Scutellospora calospora]
MQKFPQLFRRGNCGEGSINEHNILRFQCGFNIPEHCRFRIGEFVIPEIAIRIEKKTIVEIELDKCERSIFPFEFVTLESEIFGIIRVHITHTHIEHNEETSSFTSSHSSTDISTEECNV